MPARNLYKMNGNMSDVGRRGRKTGDRRGTHFTGKLTLVDVLFTIEFGRPDGVGPEKPSSVDCRLSMDYQQLAF